jgi:hypothetical protein
MNDEEAIAKPKPRRRNNAYARRNYYDNPWGTRRGGPKPRPAVF